MDDVVEAFLAGGQRSEVRGQSADRAEVQLLGRWRRSYTVTLGRLAELIRVVPRDAADACWCRISATTSPASSMAPTSPTWSRTTSPTIWPSARTRVAALAEFVKSASVRPDLRLAHQAGHHPRQPLPPYQDREVPGRGRGGDHPLPPHSERGRDRVPCTWRGLPGGRYSPRLHPFDRERRRRTSWSRSSGPARSSIPNGQIRSYGMAVQAP